MVDFGKEFLMVDSYNNIQWLIWIQIFVFFLLLFLFVVFGLLSEDNSCSSADSVPISSGSSLSRRYFSGDPIPIIHHGLEFSVSSSQGHSIQIKREATTRREGEESSSHHPCNLFQLAGTAFLKCFGIHRSTKDSLRQESKKQI